MKKQLGFLLIFLPSILFGQDFQSKFQNYLQNNDTIKQFETLIEWEKDNPKDPELFTSYFNYYFSKSRKEIITLTKNKPTSKYLSIKDSTNQEAGYLGSEIFYDPKIYQKGLKKIDKGIELYPDRLDMRFGKIYVLGELKQWEKFTDEIIKTIKYSAINKNNWYWTNNKKTKDSETFFLSSLQDYQVQLYNTGSDDLLLNMRKIALEVLNYYPNHIESLSNLSVTYLLTKEYDKAIKPLLKAEKLNPKDYIVLSNIAQAYKLKNNKEKAIEYYKKTIKYGDERSKEYAKQQIKELKK